MLGKSRSTSTQGAVVERARCSGFEERIRHRGPDRGQMASRRRRCYSDVWWCVEQTREVSHHDYTTVRAGDATSYVAPIVHRLEPVALLVAAGESPFSDSPSGI